MKVHIKQAKAEFIDAWGGICPNWGLPRTTGQIHAFLLVNSQPKGAEDIMDALSVASGTTNMAVRELTEWGLLYKSSKPGERKIYYTAEKDVFKIAQIVARERRRKELDPILSAIPTRSTIEGPRAEVREFAELMTDIKTVADMADKAIGIFAKTGVQALVKFFR